MFMIHVTQLTGFMIQTVLDHNDKERGDKTVHILFLSCFSFIYSHHI